MAWSDVEREAANQGISARLVAMEAMHAVVLDELYSHPASAELNFHGGTCIRMVWGGYRYSEDLDFASLLDETALTEMMESLRPRLERRLQAVLGPG